MATTKHKQAGAVASDRSVIADGHAALASIAEIARDAGRLVQSYETLMALGARRLLDHDDDAVLDSLAELHVALTLLETKAPHVRAELEALADRVEGRSPTLAG